jgi:hypothetical protein
MCYQKKMKNCPWHSHYFRDRRRRWASYGGWTFACDGSCLQSGSAGGEGGAAAVEIVIGKGL